MGVIDDTLMSPTQQTADHIGTHTAEANHSYLHRELLSRAQPNTPFHALVLDAFPKVTRGSRIRREPCCFVTYDHAHWVKTRSLFSAWGRKAMWIAAQASQATNPLNRSRPVSRIAKLRPITAIFPLS